MPLKTRIAISEPCVEHRRKYFSFQLKQIHYTEPCEYQRASQLLVISNIQGDFQLFRRLLIQNGVINKKYHWIFGDKHLVIAGNCFGEDEMSMECLWLAYSLEDKARKHGGYVHFLLGRNEMKHLNGNWQFQQPRYAHSQKTAGKPYAILYDGNRELRRWLQTKNIIEKIGDTVISYADVRNEISSSGMSIEQLNNNVRRFYCISDRLYAEPVVDKILNDGYVYSKDYVRIQQVNSPTETEFVQYQFVEDSIMGCGYIFLRSRMVKEMDGEMDQVKALFVMH